LKKALFKVDACVILPATNIGEWNRLCGYFDVETVDQVVAETQRGDMTRRSYVKNDSLVSLENLLKECGAPKKAMEKLDPQATEKFLSGVKSNFALGLVK
jgi:hypothetical protein